MTFKADMRKIMLTVFKHNKDGEKFFRNLMKFETDETSPVDDVYEQVTILLICVTAIVCVCFFPTSLLPAFPCQIFLASHFHTYRLSQLGLGYQVGSTTDHLFYYIHRTPKDQSTMRAELNCLFLKTCSQWYESFSDLILILTSVVITGVVKFSMLVLNDWRTLHLKVKTSISELNLAIFWLQLIKSRSVFTGLLIEACRTFKAFASGAVDQK